MIMGLKLNLPLIISIRKLHEHVVSFENLYDIFYELLIKMK